MVWIRRFGWLLLGWSTTVVLSTLDTTQAENSESSLESSSKTENVDVDAAAAHLREEETRGVFGSVVQAPSGSYISYPSFTWPAVFPIPSPAPHLPNNQSPVDDRLVEPFQQPAPTASPFDGRPTTLFVVGLVQNMEGSPVIQVNLFPNDVPVVSPQAPTPPVQTQFPPALGPPPALGVPTPLAAPIWPPFLTSGDFVGQPSPMIVIVPRPTPAEPQFITLPPLPLPTQAPRTPTVAPVTSSPTATPTVTSVVVRS